MLLLLPDAWLPDDGDETEGVWLKSLLLEPIQRLGSAPLWLFLMMEGDEERGSPSRERSAEKRAPHSLSDLSGSGERVGLASRPVSEGSE